MGKIETPAPETALCFWCGAAEVEKGCTLCPACRNAARAAAEKQRLKGWKTTGRPES